MNDANNFGASVSINTIPVFARDGKFGAVNYEAKVFLNKEYLGCNTKGLLSEDKTYKKPAFYVMQQFYKDK